MKRALSTYINSAYVRYAQVGKSVFLKIVGAFLAFLWQLITYRTLGAAAGGLLAIFQSELRLAGTLAAIGLDRELTLILPRTSRLGSPTQRHEIVGGALTIGALFGLIAASVVTIFSHFGSGYVSSPWLIFIGVLSFTWLVIIAGALRGLHMPLLADIEFTIGPMLISSVGILLLAASALTSARNCALILVLGQAAVVAMACFVLGKAALSGQGYPFFSLRLARIGQLIRGINVPLAICSSASTLFPDVILVTVGYLSSSTSAAAFGVAVRYIRLARFVPVSFLHVKEPKLAALMDSEDPSLIKTEIRIAARGAFIISFMVLLFLAICSSRLMGIFGRDFTAMTSVFYIVIVAELVNSISLMPPSVMLMSNRAVQMAVIYLMSYVLGLSCAVFASDRMGGVGAALGLLVANSILAVWSASACRRKVGIKADMFPGLGFKEGLAS